MSSQIKKGAVFSYATVAFNALAGLLYTPWMISVIGSDDYALYTLALSVVNFFLIDFGLSDSATRFMSKFYAEGKEEVIGVFLGITYKAYLLLDLVAFFVLFLIYLNIDGIYSNLSHDQLAIFKVLFGIVSVYSLVSFPFITFNATLRSNEKFVQLYACNFFERVANVCIIIIALVMHCNVYALVLSNAFTSLLFVLIKYLCIRKFTSARAKLSAWDSGLLKEIVGFSLWVTVSQVCQRMIFAVMPSIVAMVSTTWEVTIFGLASSMESYIYSVASALNGMFMPKVSRVLVGKNVEDLQNMVTRYGRVQLFIVGLIIAIVFCLGDSFVFCWMGGEYGSLYPCIVLLVLPQLIDLPLLIAHTAAIASNLVKEKAKIYLMMAGMNIVLGYMLSGILGAFGASLSICIVYFFRTSGMCFVYRSKLHLKLGRYFADAYTRWFIPFFVSIVLGFAISYFLPINNWLQFFAEAAVVVLAYCAILYFFVFNDYEKGLVNGLKMKLIKK